MNMIKKMISVAVAMVLMTSGVSIECAQSLASGYDTSDVKNIFVKSGEPEGNGLYSNPYGTLEKAMAKVIRLRTIYPNDEIRIILMDGEYEIKDTINLSQYSGSGNDARLKIMAYQGETPILKSSESLDKSRFSKVTDENILSRLDEKARDNILCMSLEEYDFTGKNPEQISSYIKIYSDNKEQPIAQWPNGEHNYAQFSAQIVGDTVSTTNKTGQYGKFSCSAEEPYTWREPQEAVAFGYFGYDYRSESVRIASIDAENKQIELAGETAFGVKNENSRRWKAYNILEELDIPGEWYLDRDNKLLYYYPTDNFENETLEISVWSDYMFDLKNTSNITFEGITFQNTSGGIMSCYTDSSNRTENISINNCTFKNIGGNVFNCYTYDYLSFYDYAAYQNRIGNIYNLEITNNIFYNFYSTPIIIYSGNIETQEYAGVIVKNNYSNQPAALSKSAYLLGSVNSVGAEVKNNLLHNTPYHVLGADGYKNEIMYNEVVSTVRETSDAGAFYVGRTVMHRDNEYAYNFFYKTAPEQENLKPYMHNRAIYFDDGYSGGYVHDNISVDGDKSFHTSGAGNRYENNISVDSFMWFEIWKGVDRYSKLMGFMNYGKDITEIDSSELENYEMTESEKKVSARTKAFLEKFPQIKNEYEKIKEKNFQITANNEVKGNLTVNAKAPDFDWSNDMKEANTLENNITVTDESYSMFVNPAELDFRVKKDSDVYQMNQNLISEDFDLNTIGLQDEFDKTRITSNRTFSKLYPQKDASDFAVGEKIEFMWERAFDADRYRIEIAEDENFENIMVSETVAYNHYDYVIPDNNHTVYYWRVYAINETRSMSGEWMCSEGVSRFFVKNTKSPILNSVKVNDNAIELEYTQPMSSDGVDKITLVGEDGNIECSVLVSGITITVKPLSILRDGNYLLTVSEDIKTVYGIPYDETIDIDLSVNSGDIKVNNEGILEFLKAENDILNNRIKIYFSKRISKKSIEMIKLYGGDRIYDCDITNSETEANVIYVNTNTIAIDNAMHYVLVIPNTVKTVLGESLKNNVYISISNMGIEDDFDSEGGNAALKWKNNTSGTVTILDNSLFMGNFTVNEEAASIPYNQGAAWIRPADNEEYSFGNSAIEFDYQNNADGTKFNNGSYENFRVFMRLKNVSLSGSNITSDGGYFLEISQYGKSADIRRWDGSSVSIAANKGKIGESISQAVTVTDYEYCSKVRYKITLENTSEGVAIAVYMAQYENGALGAYNKLLSAVDRDSVSLSGSVYFAIDSSDMNKYIKDEKVVYGYGYINSHQIDNYKFYSTLIEGVETSHMIKDVDFTETKIIVSFTGPVEPSSIDRIKVKNNTTGEFISDAAEINSKNGTQVIVPYNKIKGSKNSYSLHVEKGIKTVTGEMTEDERIYDFTLDGAGYCIEENSAVSTDFKVYYGKDQSVPGVENGIDANLKDGWIFISKKPYGEEIFEDNTSYSGGGMIIANNYSDNFIADSVLEFDYKNMNLSTVNKNGSYAGMRIFLRSGEVSNIFQSYWSKISSEEGAYIVTLYRDGDSLYAGLKKWDGTEYNLSNAVHSDQNITSTLISNQKICDYIAGESVRIRIKTENTSDGMHYVMYIGKYIDGAIHTWKKVAEYTDESDPILSGGIFFTACGTNAAYTNGYISSNFIKDINYWNVGAKGIEMLSFGERKIVNLTGEQIDDLTEYKENKITLKQNILSRYSENEGAVMYYAIYDKNGKLLAVKKQGIAIVPGAYEYFVEMTVPIEITEGYTQKIFVWKADKNAPMLEAGKF